jgi:SprT-like family protein
MLHALRSLLGGGRRDPAQLTLELDAGRLRTADDLLARLRSLGLKRIATCRLTRNANVMVSWRGDELRVHEGYLSAPADVHEAIVAFVESRSPAERRAASKRIVSVAGTTWRDSGRRERTRPEDEPLARRLEEWHARLNAEYFGGELRAVPIRVSRRMKSRLGHYSAGEPVDRSTGRPGLQTARGLGEIAISWRHVRRHRWEEVVHTLIHEMVHQWQDETGLPIDHGARFRAKARDVGIDAAAKRAVAHRSS